MNDYLEQISPQFDINQCFLSQFTNGSQESNEFKNPSPTHLFCNFLLKYFFDESIEKTIVYYSIPYRNVTSEHKCLLNVLTEIDSNFTIYGVSFGMNQEAISCFQSLLVDNLHPLLISLMVTFILSLLYLKILLISLAFILVFLFSLFISFQLFSIISFSNSLSFINITLIFGLFFINLFDSFIWSVSYWHSKRKLSSVDLSPKALKFAFYFIIPKNILFPLAISSSYYNKILLFQISTLYFMIFASVYALISFVIYSVTINFLFRTNCNVYYIHRLKVFKFDINELKENFFRKNFPHLVQQFNVLWLVVLTCTSIASSLIIFYTPELKLAKQFDRFQFSANRNHMIDIGHQKEIHSNRNFTIDIIWGAKLGSKDKVELEPEMQSSAELQFQMMHKLCREIEAEKNIRRVLYEQHAPKRQLVFNSYFYESIVRAIKPSDKQSISLFFANIQCFPDIAQTASEKVFILKIFFIR